MSLDEAIDQLRAFLARHGRNPRLGKTVAGVSSRFEKLLHVLWSESGAPIWAWVNATSGDGNAIGYYFPRRSNPISYGDATNPRPPGSREETFPLPLA
jgi:hypothetical protein